MALFISQRGINWKKYAGQCLAWIFSFLFIWSIFPATTLAQEYSFKTDHFIFYYSDQSLTEKVKSLGDDRERFWQFLKEEFPQAKDPGIITCYVYSSWEEANEKSKDLPSDAIFNVYQEGIFQRSEEISSLVRRSLGESASFLENGLIKLLWDKFRGIDPHTSVLLYLKEGMLYTPEDMMLRPYSIYTTATYSSFLAFLLDNYEQSKLLNLLSQVQDWMIYKGSYLFADTVARIYGKSLNDLSSEWQHYIKGKTPPEGINSKSYREVADFLNTSANNFYLWIEFPNFSKILNDYGLLYYYFESLDVDRAVYYMNKLKEDVTYNERVWRALRSPEFYLLAGLILFGLIILGFLSFFLYRWFKTHRQMRTLSAARQNEDQNFQKFLKEGKK